jgi:hypothetical protein
MVALAAFTTPPGCSLAGVKLAPSRCPQRRSVRRSGGWRCATLASRRKAELLDAVRPLNGGLSVLSQPGAQREIAERVAELEGMNPCARPTESELLRGVFRMVYTTSGQILGAKRPRAFRPAVEKLYQIIAPDLSVRNVEVLFPFGEGAWRPAVCNAVRAAATVASASRVNVQFTKFELLNNLVSFDVSNDARFANWLDTTYLDSTMRISRGGEGNLFVLVREDQCKF